MKHLKSILSLALAIAVLGSVSITAMAADNSGVEEIEREAFVSITGTLPYETMTRATVEPVNFLHSTGIDKKLLSKNWRGTSTLTTEKDIDCEFYLHVQLWKDGHYYTSNNDRSSTGTWLTVNTKWVSGSDGGQFGAHSTGVITGANGEKLYDATQSCGYPFE